MHYAKSSKTLTTTWRHRRSWCEHGLSRNSQCLCVYHLLGTLGCVQLFCLPVFRWKTFAIQSKRSVSLTVAGVYSAADVESQLSSRLSKALQWASKDSNRMDRTILAGQDRDYHHLVAETFKSLQEGFLVLSRICHRDRSGQYRRTHPSGLIYLRTLSRTVLKTLTVRPFAAKTWRNRWQTGR